MNNFKDGTMLDNQQNPLITNSITNAVFIMRKQMDVVKIIAKEENVNLDRIFSFIIKNNFENHMGKLIMIDDFWTYLKKPENRGDLLDVWSMIMRMPDTRIDFLYFDESLDEVKKEKERETILNWCKNIPMELFTAKKISLRSNTHETLITKNFPFFKELARCYERKLAQERETHLMDSLNIEDKKENKKKRRI